MFNLDPEKILVILVVAIIFVGPEKLPGLARKAGNFASKLNDYKEKFTQELKNVAPDVPSEEIIGQINQIRSIVRPSRYISSYITGSAINKTASLENTSTNNELFDETNQSGAAGDTRFRSSINRFGEGNLIWSVEDPRLN